MDDQDISATDISSTIAGASRDRGFIHQGRPRPIGN